MIRVLLHKMLARFEAINDYDASYIHQVTDIWPGAGMRYMALSAVSQMKGPAPAVWAGALMASTLDGDCGPCAQLVAGFALDTDVPPDHIAACLRRDFDAAGDAGLGFRFAEAAINDLPDADDLRGQIRNTYGDRAVIAASYATASGRAYPVMKRALGHGKACHQIVLGGTAHRVVKLNE